MIPATVQPAEANHRLWLAAVLVLLLGAVLRFAYYDSTYGPGDEQITIEVVRYMRHSGDWDTNWARADLPPALRYDQYNFSSHLYATFLFYRAAKLIPWTDAWRAEGGGFLVYRFFVALLATIAVAQTFLLGLRVAGELAALGAAALVAVMPLLVQDAHYIRPEPFVTVLTLGAILLAWPQPTPSVPRLLGAGWCIGLLVACKISMLLLVWIPFVAIFAAQRSTRAHWPTLAATGGIMLGFVTGAPNAVLHPDVLVHGVRALTAQYAGLHPPHSHLHGGPVADMLLRYFAATLGWPLLAAFGAGVAVLLARRRWSVALLLVAPVFLFTVYFGTRRVFFERNLSHVMPLVAIVATAGGVALAGWLGPRLRIAPAALAAVLLGVACLRPVSITWPLLAAEYANHAAGNPKPFEDAVRARYPAAEWRDATLLTNAPVNELVARFREKTTPVLLSVTDYRDEWTAWNTGILERELIATEVAVDPGPFPRVPTSTLLTYHRAKTRVYLVTGCRAASARAIPRRRSGRASSIFCTAR